MSFRATPVSSGFSTPVDLVLLLQDLEFGGTQRYAVHLLKHLDRRLFTPRLWILRGGLDMAQMAEETGVEVLWLSRSSWVGPRSLAHLAWQLIRHRPRILYTLTVVPNIWGRLFGALARVPVILTSWRDLYPKQYESWMWPLSTRIICNAGVLKQILLQRHGVDPQRVVVIPNAVDPDHFTPARDERAKYPTVLYVGRLAPEKGLLILLDGFRQTLERIPDARLVILGNGRLRKKLGTVIRRFSLEDRVRLLPGHPDPRPDMRKAWVLAMASVREAFPNVLLEAMAMEIPVVAPRVGGIPELVQDGETGLTFEPGNPEALAQAMIQLLEDEAQRRLMGQKGRERVLACYRMERMIAETQRALMDALGGKSRP